MIEKNQINMVFQTFFVSREVSNCPLLIDIVKFGKQLDNLGLLQDSECSVSLGYGKRILINAKDVDFRDLERQDIVEIVDYDPIKHLVLAIGKKYPSLDTPVHWIIQRARYDVNAVFLISSEKLIEYFCNILPVTEKEACRGTIEYAKMILKALQKGRNIVVRNDGVVFVGVNLKEIEDFLFNNI